MTLLFEAFIENSLFLFARRFNAQHEDFLKLHRGVHFVIIYRYYSACPSYPTEAAPVTRRILVSALLHAPTCISCQVSICKWAFQTLIELVESGKSPRSPPSSLTQSDFAASILINCTGNPFCRSIMFQEQVRSYQRCPGSIRYI